MEAPLRSVRFSSDAPSSISPARGAPSSTDAVTTAVSAALRSPAVTSSLRAMATAIRDLTTESFALGVAEEAARQAVRLEIKHRKPQPVRLLPAEADGSVQDMMKRLVTLVCKETIPLKALAGQKLVGFPLSHMRLAASVSARCALNPLQLWADSKSSEVRFLPQTITVASETALPASLRGMRVGITRTSHTGFDSIVRFLCTGAQPKDFSGVPEVSPQSIGWPAFEQACTAYAELKSVKLDVAPKSNAGESAALSEWTTQNKEPRAVDTFDAFKSSLKGGVDDDVAQAAFDKMRETHDKWTAKKNEFVRQLSSQSTDSKPHDSKLETTARSVIGRLAVLQKLPFILDDELGYAAMSMRAFLSSPNPVQGLNLDRIFSVLIDGTAPPTVVMRSNVMLADTAGEVCYAAAHDWSHLIGELCMRHYERLKQKSVDLAQSETWKKLELSDISSIPLRSLAQTITESGGGSSCDLTRLISRVLRLTVAGVSRADDCIPLFRDDGPGGSSSLSLCLVPPLGFNGVFPPPPSLGEGQQVLNLTVKITAYVVSDTVGAIKPLDSSAAATTATTSAATAAAK